MNATRRKATWAGAAWIAVSALLTLLVFGSTAAADDTQWNSNKNDCEFVLKAPDRYELGSLEECAVLWEQYKEVSRLSPDERKLFARGFSWLFVYGNANQKALAKGALERIGKPRPLCLVGGAWLDPNIGQDCAAGTKDPSKEVFAFPEAGSVQVRKSSSGQVGKAERLAKDGIRLNKRRQYAAAVGKFEQALAADPFNVSAQYNLACAMAMLGDDEGTVRALSALRSWDNSAAQAKFSLARSDKDFEPVHNSARFRQLVGLVRIQLLNGAGEPGLFHVGRIRKDLMQRNFFIGQYGFDRHTRRRPLIYYRKGYGDQAQMAKSIVNNIRTATLEIYWDSSFDLIIVWGDPDFAAGAGATGPVVQGEAVKDRGDAAKEFLDKFNESKDTASGLKDAATSVPDLPK